MAPKQILIIDDEDDIREVAQVSLEMMGNWAVLTACSGQEGLTKAEAEQPDAILLDVMMPDMDGPSTFQQLQQIPALCHIPVILMTAKVQASDQRRFASLGVQGVIAKPFDPLTLADQVAETLGWN
jgi:CheY-like chemotaxis protein